MRGKIPGPGPKKAKRKPMNLRAIPDQGHSAKTTTGEPPRAPAKRPSGKARQETRLSFTGKT